MHTASILLAIWVIGGSTQTPSSNPCIATTWLADTVLLNSTDNVATVSQNSFSDRLGAATPRTFTIAPHSTTTMSRQRALAHVGQPNTPVWLDELDLPLGVFADSRIEIGASACNVSPPIFGPVNGKLSTPMFTSLVPANTVQRHIGTDLGLLDARVNVGIFNGGSSGATAHVELRRACDDALLAQQTISLDPNALRQISLSSGAPKAVCPGADAGYWVTYTTVTVDQPSLSFVSTISNNLSEPVGPIFAPYSVTTN